MKAISNSQLNNVMEFLTAQIINDALMAMDAQIYEEQETAELEEIIGPQNSESYNEWVKSLDNWEEVLEDNQTAESVMEAHTRSDEYLLSCYGGDHAEI